VEDKKDLVTGIGFFSLGIFLLIQSLLLENYNGVVAGTDPGIKFLPIIISILLILDSILLITTNIIKARTRRIEKSNTSISVLETIDRNKKLLLTIVILMVFPFILKPAGFLISVSVFTFLLLRILSNSRWHKSVITSLLITLFCYAVFGYLFKIPLP